MIPKIIHFCWLSDEPYPEIIRLCMDSWHKYLPDYEFVHWDLQKLNEIDSIWAKQAFEHKKYAFAADFIRCYSVYNFGGIYLDTDVELFDSFDSFLNLKAFMGLDSRGDLEAAVFGAEKHAEWLGKALEFYKDRKFVNTDGTFNIITMPNVFKSVFNQLLGREYPQYEEISDLSFLTLFPPDFFSPKDYTTGVVRRTSRTVAVHHFEAGWLNKSGWGWRKHQFKIFLKKLIGYQMSTSFSKI